MEKPKSLFSMMTDYRKGRWIFVNEDWRSAYVELGELLGVKVEALMLV